MKKPVHMKRMLRANSFQGVFCARDLMVSFRVACFLLSCRLFSRTRAKVRKKQRQPTIPKIPMTTLKPSASLPWPTSWTRVSAVAETMVEPMKARNLRHVARTVRSFMSSVRAGRIDASGILTTVYMKERKM